MKYVRLFDSFSNNELDIIEDYFLSLADYKDHDIPISVDVSEHNINSSKRKSLIPSSLTITPGYKVYIIYDFYDHNFVKKEVTQALNRLSTRYNIHYSQISKTGNGNTVRDIPVHGTDRTTRVVDPKWKWTITLSKKKLNESIDCNIESIEDYLVMEDESGNLKLGDQYNESNLIIVDVQKSFKKFFTDNYLSQLNSYASKFTNVYQIWDNHSDKDADKDYLYDKTPDKPINNDDLYKFNNQKDLIEKRYQYDVNVDFYAKILDTAVYQDAKNKEDKGILRRGDYFVTREGTIIVYIGNNHVWYHVPKKLYDLFISLKGKNVTIVGGSMNECLLDIETAARSLGVPTNRDYTYIYSASHCPIK